jgi:hypothetical protein
VVNEQERRKRAESLAEWIKTNRPKLAEVARQGECERGRGAVVISARDGGGTNLAYTTMQMIHETTVSDAGYLTLAALVKRYDPSHEFVVFMRYPEGEYFAAEVKHET